MTDYTPNYPRRRALEVLEAGTTAHPGLSADQIVRVQAIELALRRVPGTVSPSVVLEEARVFAAYIESGEIRRP